MLGNGMLEVIRGAVLQGLLKKEDLDNATKEYIAIGALMGQCQEAKVSLASMSSQVLELKDAVKTVEGRADRLAAKLQGTEVRIKELTYERDVARQKVERLAADGQDLSSLEATFRRIAKRRRPLANLLGAEPVGESSQDVGCAGDAKVAYPPATLDSKKLDVKEQSAESPDRYRAIGPNQAKVDCQGECPVGVKDGAEQQKVDPFVQEVEEIAKKVREFLWPKQVIDQAPQGPPKVVILHFMET